ncbi:hypothetical protein H6P81_017258 [Aristolochia fimbriata]|uniref:Uncharacterized protein n=1 Tax=Aristolochia fimbriata TaxID=158543 RepID=A0AAV7DYP2_ARIFI|nr:hypothetical protein H6P81_017258 [Aristolochia fimbriata]
MRFIDSEIYEGSRTTSTSSNFTASPPPVPSLGAPSHSGVREAYIRKSLPDSRLVDRSAPCGLPAPEMTKMEMTFLL